MKYIWRQSEGSGYGEDRGTGEKSCSDCLIHQLKFSIINLLLSLNKKYRYATFNNYILLIC